MTYDVVIIGGGIVGLATASALLCRFPELQPLLLEKETYLAAHQTGRNSGVIHSGIYYRPGSLKAKLCVTGARLLTDFCDLHQISYQRYGKVIVAVEDEELPQLETLYQWGLANRVRGLSKIGPEHLRELEPHVHGIQALCLPHVAVVDYTAVARGLGHDIEQAGGTIELSARVTRIRERFGHWQLQTTRGEYQARFLINCGGLHADRLARMAHDHSSVRIMPFRGEYYTVPSSRASLVHGLVYPVPTPATPFLGVHFTKTVGGDLHVGPNAVLAFKREGYTKMEISLRDCLELVTYPGFWRMVSRYWHVGIEEVVRAWSKHHFLRAAQRLVPALTKQDLLPSPSGVRAQAVDLAGTLVDDFLLHSSRHALHVYNAPSPAATASLSIGNAIVEHLATALSTLRSRVVISAD